MANSGSIQSWNSKRNFGLIFEFNKIFQREIYQMKFIKFFNQEIKTLVDPSIAKAKFGTAT